jgi:hypothetical protein
MNRIRVVDVCGSCCVVPDDGAKLCGLIREGLDRGEVVLLDFSGVDTLGGNFLSAAVGALYGFYSRKDLDARLRWEGLAPEADAVLRVVQGHAILFFSATPDQQEALLAASLRLPGE